MLLLVFVFMFILARVSGECTYGALHMLQLRTSSSKVHQMETPIARLMPADREPWAIPIKTYPREGRNRKEDAQPCRADIPEIWEAQKNDLQVKLTTRELVDVALVGALCVVTLCTYKAILGTGTETLALGFVFLLSLALVVFGVVMLVYEEDLYPTTALYVVAQMVTTIGYGDFTVQRDISKFYVALYAVVNLVIIAWVVQRFFLLFVSKASKQIYVLLASQEKSIQHIDLVIAALIAMSMIVFGTVFFATYEACTCSYGRSRIESCVEDTYQSCVDSGGFVKTWFASFYMSVITLTSIGFGDHSPRSLIGRRVAIVWMFVGAASTANFFGKLCVFMFERENDLQWHEDISSKIFQEIDADGSGMITRGEYYKFMLRRCGIVDADVFGMLDKQYDVLDEGRENSVTLQRMLSAMHSDKTKGAFFPAPNRR